MRKWIAAVMLAAIVCMLTVPAMGAEEGLEIPDVTVEPGETVYLTFKLAGPVTGTSVAVTYTCDRDVITPIKSSSTWAQKGMLQDFDSYKMTGVWAERQAVELKGEICTVAFRVVSEKTHFDTKVACTLTVKNGAAEVASFTEEVWVSTACNHSFGAWTENGSVSHQRTCSICLRVQQQAHKWDEGTKTKDPEQENKEIILFRCTECGGKKEVPYLPNTKPSDGEQLTAPTQGSDQSTKPEEDHDHDHGTEPTEKDTHDHDHGTSVTDRKTRIKNALVLLGTLGVLIGAAWLIARKKR